MNSDEQPDEFERYQHRDPCRDHSGPIRPGRSDTELVIDLLSFPYTDTGNAERLVAMYGDLIRFCPERRKWLIWDGKRWNSEDTRRVKMLMKRTTRMMFAQAAEIADKELRTAAEKFARRSESAAAISAALTCAEYEDGVPIRARELDSHRLLINFQNGTFDFETSRLREHRREDLLTKIVHFPYNPDATCPIFTAFIYRIAGDGPVASERDRERAERVVRYIQKCIGYAMTGDNYIRDLFLRRRPGRTF
jgi:putative DNA primase/helicase